MAREGPGKIGGVAGWGMEGCWEGVDEDRVAKAVSISCARMINLVFP